MARENRARLYSKVCQVYTNSQRSLEVLQELHELFKAQHPELLEGLEIAAALMIQSQEVYVTFCNACWGKHPLDFEVYANPTKDRG